MMGAKVAGQARESPWEVDAGNSQLTGSMTDCISSFSFDFLILFKKNIIKIFGFIFNNSIRPGPFRHTFTTDRPLARLQPNAMLETDSIY